MAASSRISSVCGKVYSGNTKRRHGSPNVNSIEVGDSWVRLKKCYCDPTKFYDIRVSGSINNLGRIYYKCMSCQAFEWGYDADLKENIEEAAPAEVQGPAPVMLNGEQFNELKATVEGLSKKVDSLLKVLVFMKFVVMLYLLLVFLAIVK